MQLSQFSLSALLGLACSVLPLAAQQEAPPYQQMQMLRDTGWVSNQGTQTEVIASFSVYVEGAQWLRLYFDEAELGGDARTGDGAILRITSHLDGEVQELNSIHLGQWQNSTAYFNGDSVQVEIVAPPGTESRLRIRSADIGQPASQFLTICGPVDNRELSSDPRAARVAPVGCTGWLIDDCRECALSAGHCAGGGLSVLQFNVPLSNFNGSWNNPSPSDQYAIDSNSLQATNTGVGGDWAYFGSFPNSNTGLTAGEAQGGTYALANPPGSSNGNTIRITGYGTDSTPNSTYNQAQQTSTGPMSSVSQTTLRYVTDTTGGNSGSPVIWENTGQAIGIHTNGGCSSGGGSNIGTARTSPGLANALLNPQGVCVAGFDFPEGLPETFSSVNTTRLAVIAQGDLIANGVDLNLRTEAGQSYTVIPMQGQGGGLYTLDLSPVECGSSPEFFFSAFDLGCGDLLSPPLGGAEPYTAFAAPDIASFEDNMETDQGWLSESAGATSGLWERGVPVNDGNVNSDPISDSDGSGQAYLTDNSIGTSDVDDGIVNLTSPALTLGAYDSIEYDYFLFLSSQDGSDRLSVQGSDNGLAGPWIELKRYIFKTGNQWESDRVTSAEWSEAGLAPGPDSHVRFAVNDGGAGGTVEAGIDAFRVSSFACGDETVGNNFCQSGAAGSVITGTGSSSIALNDLVLHASTPPFKPGLFIYSNLQQQIPFGQGSLCIAGSSGIFRLPPTFSGAEGELVHAFDNTSPPNVFGFVSPGTTWNFQAWFRLGASFDLSNGLEIEFTP